MDWWKRQWRGSFDLHLYLEICRIKKNENQIQKPMKRFKATFKTWAYVGAPVKLETRIVEAYDIQHVKNLIQKTKTKHVNTNKKIRRISYYKNKRIKYKKKMN